MLLTYMGLNALCMTTSASEKFLNFIQITESEFRIAQKNNYNAPFITEVSDSTKIEKALDAIDVTYSEFEKELADRELCDSPRCLTSFNAYYPTLDLYLFEILDYHDIKACFVYASTSKLASNYRRFYGSYGVMSKDGAWVGLARDDCDNFLQIEVCKLEEFGFWSVLKFDFSVIDINDEEYPVMFWADKNTIYIAISEYDRKKDKQPPQYYSIKFGL